MVDHTNDPVRWGILGAANIGVRKVIPAMQRGARSRVVAIASRTFAKAQKAADDLGIPRSYGAYEDLLADPEVLLLDEPYAGFDFDTYLKFWDQVAERRERGRSVLIISHFVTDEERFDRIVELREGRAVPR